MLGADALYGEHEDHRPALRQHALWGEGELDYAVQVAELASQPVSLAPAQSFVPQAVRPVHVEPAEDGRHWLFEFDEYVVGRLHLKVQSYQSVGLRVRYGEGDAEDSLTTAGEGAMEYFSPRFVERAFRTLRVQADRPGVELLEVQGVRLAFTPSSSMRLRSDHSALNGLIEAARLSLLAGVRSAPMAGLSARHRYPDFGYAVSWLPLVALDFGAHAIVQKYVRDLVAGFASHDDASPYGVADGPLDDHWARFELLTELVWCAVFQHHDRRCLQECYATLRAWALSFPHQCRDLLRRAPRADLYGAGQEGVLVATCAIYEAVRKVGLLAEEMDAAADAARLAELADKICGAVRRGFITADGHVLGDSQAVYLAVLHFDLMRGDESRVGARRLSELVRTEQYHARVPPRLVSALLPVLTSAGRADVAYMVLLQTSPPSWLAGLEDSGKVLVDARGNMDLAQAGFLRWVLLFLVGIRLPGLASAAELVRYRETTVAHGAGGGQVFHIEPKPPLGHLFLAGAPVEFVAATVPSLWGDIQVSWHISDEAYTLEVGVAAIVFRPGDHARRHWAGCAQWPPPVYDGFCRGRRRRANAARLGARLIRGGFRGWTVFMIWEANTVSALLRLMMTQRRPSHSAGRRRCSLWCAPWPRAACTATSTSFAMPLSVSTRSATCKTATTGVGWVRVRRC